MRRPTSTPVAGRAGSGSAAREVDLTRRAPVTVVPRRPDARSDAAQSDVGRLDAKRPPADTSHGEPEDSGEEPGPDGNGAIHPGEEQR